MRRLSVETALPVAVLLLTAMGFAASPLISGATVGSFSVFNVGQQLAWVAPLALAIGITMMCAEFDLSVAGIASFAGVLSITVDSPLLGAAAAVAAGAFLGVVHGLLISRLRISSVPVTLASYIALIGGTLWLSGDRILSYDDASVALWITQPIATILSPSVLIMIGLFAAVGVPMAFLTWGRDLRAVGGDRRAARAAGVRVDALLVSAFTTSGILAASSGVLLAFSTASANPNPDIRPLVLGVVAALAGGATLKGGRGRTGGLLAGATAVCLLQATFSVNAIADWLSQLLFAALLIAVAAADAPDLARALTRVKASRTPAHPPTTEVLS